MAIEQERRIYSIVASTIQVPVSVIRHEGHVHADMCKGVRTVIQPPGRQAAQAAHVVSKLRFDNCSGPAHPGEFQPITTIILQCRDSAELGHIFYWLNRRKLNPVIFSDNNPEYGPGDWPTAVAVHATPKQIQNVLDYLPLFLKDVK